jgi:hypothetical protein
VEVAMETVSFTKMADGSCAPTSLPLAEFEGLVRSVFSEPRYLDR